jgi:hypothetical protein
MSSSKDIDQEQLVKTIKAPIAKGDKAAEKANDHYIAAGQHLKTLKAEHDGNWADWEELLKTKIGIGKSRASELMQIADGTKTVEQVRADGAERKAKERAKSLRDVTEKSDGAPVAITTNDDSAEAMKAKFAEEDGGAPAESTTADQKSSVDYGEQFGPPPPAAIFPPEPYDPIAWAAARDEAVSDRLTKLMQRALNALGMARPDQEGAIAALRKIRAELKTGRQSVCDLQVTIRRITKAADTVAAKAAKKAQREKIQQTQIEVARLHAAPAASQAKN